MPRHRGRKQDKSISNITRRAALLAIFSGTAIGLKSTESYDVIRGSRSTELSVTSDDEALLKFDGFDSSKTYKEPHEVTITNNTRQTLDENNKAESTGDLELREIGTSNDTQSLSIDTLDPGESDSFEIVTSPNKSGKVSDTITLTLSSSTGYSFEADRTVTVEFKAGGQLVYSDSGRLTVYDAVNDQVLQPPQTPTNIDAIGANAVDLLRNSNADIPFLSTNRTIYATSVGANGDTTIFNDSKPKPKKQKTRLAVGRWPEADKVGGDIILSANQNSSDIIGFDEDGSTEVLASPPNGVSGVSGAVDFNGDGDIEIVFVDGSQSIRYLEQSGNVKNVANAGVGSNNSIGFGPPVDFGAGIEVPFIDGSNNPSLVDYLGNKTILDGSGPARKAAVAPVDIDGDDEFEFMFFGTDTGNIKYIDNVGGTNDIKTLLINGSPVQPDEKVGLNSGVDPRS
jgi:hypothetical protein